ncbi:MAG: LPP20 family lipoprotein [Candidatus Poribacteria bacterium]|nr:LPP20 family lipoprotein [Candidatus Poribacteria bacterium]
MSLRNHPDRIAARLFVLITLLGFVFSACGGKSPVSSLPDWVEQPPADPEHLYGVGTGESAEMGMALSKAEHAARVQITRNIEAKVSALFKQFTEEVGVGADAEYLSMATDVSKSVASEVLGGTRVKDQQLSNEDGRYRAWVLMEMPIGEASARLRAQIRAQQNVYTRFRASQGFQQLEEEVEKYEQWKKEQARMGMDAPTEAPRTADESE